MTIKNPLLEPYYLKQTLLEAAPLALAAPVLPQHLKHALKDLRSMCSGYLGTAKTIQYFFRLLNLIGLDSHSAFREKFWREYLKAGYITQSWLILAPAAEAAAQRELALKDYQYAKLHKCRRVDDNHAVLLMRLDHLLIAEWSHIGKCRFWFQNNLHAPNLFKKIYKREELIDFADYIQQHYFSTKGLWQKDAAAWMAAKAYVPALPLLSPASSQA